MKNILMKNEFISRNNKKNTINLFFKKIRINIRNFLKLETLKFPSEIYEFFNFRARNFHVSICKNFFQGGFFIF